MTCNICNIQYIGESSNTLITRCRGHENDIGNKKEHPVALHYNSYSHTFHDYTILAMDHECDTNKRFRLAEAWVTLMDPCGLNGRL